MAHLNYFGVENFRVFKEKTDFNFKPITLLIGANSTGKSSLNKALFLFKDTFKSAKLNFDELEDKLQLGGFENAISWNADKEEINFFMPFEIYNFPELGASTTLKCEISFTRSGLKRYSYFLDEQLLIRYDFINFYFNSKLFLNSLCKAKTLEVIETGDVNKSILFSTIKGRKGKYCIIDNSKPSNRSIVYFDPDKGEVESGEELQYTELYMSPRKEELLEILALYDNNLSTTKDDTVALSYDFESTYPDGEKYTETAYIDNPILEILNGKGLSSVQIEYINKEILNGFFLLNRTRKDHQFIKYWQNLAESIEYHQGLNERAKRIYQYGDKSNLNELLRKIDLENRESTKSFLQKWASKEWFGFIGELIFDNSSKYAFRSIQLGESSLANEGQGIAQLVYLMLDISTSKKETIFLVEEPENFLHPAYQSKLADFFIDAQKTFGHQFIIETHSEYLIRKLQYLIAKKQFKAEDTIIYNFRKVENPDAEILKPIQINEDGSLSESFYPGFFDEASSWELELLKTKRGLN
ncbi:AAA family ATPase [Jiulongibacter sediminis]|uniref:AAA family ATPase n=1 Tax=Jiulongibacter sediminis TaxID=1605367 RepID=UPI0026E9724A|nr:DUF3696 domain-containing protein [Jiulongibacter sediminis]